MTIFYRSVEKCRFCRGSKFANSHWHAQSPLTRDTAQTVINNRSSWSSGISRAPAELELVKDGRFELRCLTWYKVKLWDKVERVNICVVVTQLRCNTHRTLLHYGTCLLPRLMLMLLVYARHATLYVRSVICNITQVYIRWQWRNFFIPDLCQLFSRHDVGQALRNVSYCDINFLVRHCLKLIDSKLFE